jgi:hypothetical protein
MRRIRGLRAGLFVALCATLIGLVSAAPASASTTVAQPTPPAPTAGGGTCRITVTNTDGVFGDEVQALDLQEANGDEIFMRLNGQRFPASTTDTVEFTFAGQGHPASDFGNPTKVYDGAVRIELVEKDFLGIGNTHIIDVFLGCAPFSGTLQGIGAGAAYNVEILIQPI